MGALVYAFAVTVIVLIVGWAIYVLPTPGPLPALVLTVGLIPAFIIIGSVFATVLGLWLVAYAVRAVWRVTKRLTT